MRIALYREDLRKNLEEYEDWIEEQKIEDRSLRLNWDCLNKDILGTKKGSNNKKRKEPKQYLGMEQKVDERKEVRWRKRPEED